MKRVWFLLAILFSAEAQAKLSDIGSDFGASPVMLKADRMEYDEKAQIVSAVGRVEIVQGQRILFADAVHYHQVAGAVEAKGNISVLEPDGTVYFAKRLTLRDEMKRGVVRQFRARLQDNSLLAAAEARKLDSQRIELRRAVYSPCKVCTQDPTKPPLWQIKASDVLYDEGEQRVRYHNAIFELYGVPVAYTPYFSHPTPNADRKTGLLMPKYEVSNNLGGRLDLPVYVNIAPEMDLTVVPILTTKEGPILAGEFRHLTENGFYSFRGSITNPERRDTAGNVVPGSDWRGHIEGEGLFHLNSVWNWGFNIKRALDDTYLRRYGFGNEDMLTSRLYIEGLEGDHYATAQALSFQGLNQRANSDLTPLVFPFLEDSYMSRNMMGGRLENYASLLALSREEGAMSRRLSVMPSWTLPFVTRGGHLFEWNIRARGDFYQVEDITVEENGVRQIFDGTTGRAVPETSLAWRYPLAKPISGGSLVLEPTAVAILAPYGGNPDEIPNEDSQTRELSDLNIFSTHRFTGMDRVESGPRFSYGMRAYGLLDSLPTVYAMLGHSLYMDENNLFPRDQERRSSDIVSRVGMSSTLWDVSLRTRLNSSDLALRSMEVNNAINLHPVAFAVDYTQLVEDPVLGDRKELALASALHLTDQWTLVGANRRDLDSGGNISAGAGLIFQNECLTVHTGFNREFTRFRDIKPSSSFTVQIGLKNLTNP